MVVLQETLGNRGLDMGLQPVEHSPTYSLAPKGFDALGDKLGTRLGRSPGSEESAGHSPDDQHFVALGKPDGPSWRIEPDHGQRGRCGGSGPHGQ